MDGQLARNIMASQPRKQIKMSDCVSGDIYHAFECDTSYQGKADKDGNVTMLPVERDDVEKETR